MGFYQQKPFFFICLRSNFKLFFSNRRRNGSVIMTPWKKWWITWTNGSHVIIFIRRFFNVITDFPFRSFIAAYFKAQVNRHTKIRIIDRSFRDTNFHLFVHGKDVSNVKTFAANVDIGSSVEAILHSGSSV